MVGIADCQISNVPDHVLVTYALGSCIAVAIHDAVAGVGGLLTTCCRNPVSTL